jgi:hypothetical protein
MEFAAPSAPQEQSQTQATQSAFHAKMGSVRLVVSVRIVNLEKRAPTTVSPVRPARTGNSQMSIALVATLVQQRQQEQMEFVSLVQLELNHQMMGFCAKRVHQEGSAVMGHRAIGVNLAQPQMQKLAPTRAVYANLGL